MEELFEEESDLGLFRSDKNIRGMGESWAEINKKMKQTLKINSKQEEKENQEPTTRRKEKRYQDMQLREQIRLKRANFAIKYKDSNPIPEESGREHLKLLKIIAETEDYHPYRQLLAVREEHREPFQDIIRNEKKIHVISQVKQVPVLKEVSPHQFDDSCMTRSRNNNLYISREKIPVKTEQTTTNRVQSKEQVENQLFKLPQIGRKDTNYSTIIHRLMKSRSQLFKSNFNSQFQSISPSKVDLNLPIGLKSQKLDKSLTLRKFLSKSIHSPRLQAQILERLPDIIAHKSKHFSKFGSSSQQILKEKHRVHLLISGSKHKMQNQQQNEERRVRSITIKEKSQRKRIVHNMRKGDFKLQARILLPPAITRLKIVRNEIE